MTNKFHYPRSRYVAFTAFFAAISTVLMFLDFGVPFMPSFLKLDFSEVPALIAAFSLGPVSGVLVCLIKNLINMASSSTGCVGELSNFLLGCMFVVPAGIIYKYKRNRVGALLGALAGAVIMGLGSVLTNKFIVYPVYYNFMPENVILGMYRELYPKVEDIWDCLLIFNMPFTIMKGLCCALITFAIYKPISIAMKTIEGKFTIANRRKEIELNKRRVAAVIIPSENETEAQNVETQTAFAVQNTDSAATSDETPSPEAQSSSKELSHAEATK